jgi:hypothetical protein
MIRFDAKDTNLSVLVQERAQLLMAARDLMFADAEMMDDLGNHGCHYCTGGDDDVPDGHDLGCPFANMVEILIQPRAHGETAIKEECKAIRDALVYLVAADFQLMGTRPPCLYCDSIESHEEGCVLADAVEILALIPRRHFD